MPFFRTLSALCCLLNADVFAAEVFHTRPRSAGVALRCPLLLAQHRTARPVWHNPINRGLLHYAGAFPDVPFFRALLGEHLELEFGDALAGKRAEHTRARGRFLTLSVALEELLTYYGVGTVEELPLYAQRRVRPLQEELSALFREHVSSWTPRTELAHGFEFENGVLAGVSINLHHFFARADGLSASQAFDALARKLPRTIHRVEMFGGTTEQLRQFLRWDTQGRFFSVSITNSLGELEPLLEVLRSDGGRLQHIEFDGYDFSPESLEQLQPLAAKVPAHGANIEEFEIPESRDLLFDGRFTDASLRRIVWRNLLRERAVGVHHRRMVPHLLRDMPLLLDEPLFWKALSERPVGAALVLYEHLPMKPEARRREFLRKMLLFFPPKSLGDFVRKTLTAETKTRRKVSAAGALVADIFASELFSETRFAALQALRGIDEAQLPQESFAEARDRWLRDETTSPSNKAAYVAAEIGDPSVRALFETAPHNAHWEAVRTAVGEATLYFAWEALGVARRRASDPFALALKRDKTRWTFSAAGDGTDVSDGTFPVALFSEFALPQRLNAWAENRGHRYRYEELWKERDANQPLHIRRRPVAP